MPKKRKTKAHGNSSQKSKRLKFDNFGAANDTDHLPQAHVAAQRQQSGPSSAGACVRVSPHATANIPTLLSIAARVFAINFSTIFAREGEYRGPRAFAARHRLSQLPENLIPMILALLREHSPGYLNANMLITYFLRGQNIHLPGELPGVNVKVINSIGTQPDAGTITMLDLSRLVKIDDQVFANAVSRLPELESLVLRGCSKAGPLVLQAVAARCPRLRVLNMNYTVATPQATMFVLLACPQLAVLKMAGTPKLAPGSIVAARNNLANQGFDPAPTFLALQSLKLRLTDLTDADITAILPLCPNLTTLDISFTQIKNIPLDSPFPPLKKLCLTSTGIHADNLVSVLKRAPMLEVLHLGALGDWTPSTSKGAGTGVSAGTLTDSVLRRVTDELERCPNLNHVNLVSNSKLGSGGINRVLQDFVRRVGRKFEILNFENVPQLRSEDLEGLLRISDDDDAPSIRVLNLARTNVNDDSAPYIAACPKLEILNLAGTKLSEEGLFTILDNCPNITELDLTGCRSVSVQDRRRFFEVWELEHQIGWSTPQPNN